MAHTNGSIVSSDDVNGTEVCNHKGDHVGETDHLMIDKPKVPQLGYS